MSWDWILSESEKTGEASGKSQHSCSESPSTLGPHSSSAWCIAAYLFRTADVLCPFSNPNLSSAHHLLSFDTGKLKGLLFPPFPASMPAGTCTPTLRVPYSTDDVFLLVKVKELISLEASSIIDNI